MSERLRRLDDLREPCDEWPMLAAFAREVVEMAEDSIHDWESAKSVRAASVWADSLLRAFDQHFPGGSDGNA